MRIRKHQSSGVIYISSINTRYFQSVPLSTLETYLPRRNGACSTWWHYLWIAPGHFLLWVSTDLSPRLPNMTCGVTKSQYTSSMNIAAFRRLSFSPSSSCAPLDRHYPILYTAHEPYRWSIHQPNSKPLSSLEQPPTIIMVRGARSHLKRPKTHVCRRLPAAKHAARHRTGDESKSTGGDKETMAEGQLCSHRRNNSRARTS